MSIDYLSEDGVPIRREAITLPINKTVNRFRIHEAQLDMEVGFNDVNAKIGLMLSKDGGVTWSNTYYSYTGNIGENSTRVKWNRLGQMRDCIFKVITYDAIPIRILGFHIRAS